MFANKAITCLPEADDQKRLLLGQPGTSNLLCIGLNPGTADAQKLDPTSRNVREIAYRQGFDGWLLVNLYPKRTSRPDLLPKRANQQLFQENLSFIESLLANRPSVWLAWGNNITTARRSYMVRTAQRLEVLFRQYDIITQCIGITAAGHPLHPSPQAVNTRLGGLEKATLQDFDFALYLKKLTGNKIQRPISGAGKPKKV